jgi:carboxyl-terminal processing protease
MRLFRLAGRFSLLVPLLIGLTSCTRTTVPLTNLQVPVPIVPLIFEPIENDFSGKTWSAAFEKLHAKLSVEYPFTDWKAIDWDGLYKTYAPQVEKAQDDGDRRAYYTALRGYLWSLRDGYVDLDPAYRARVDAVGGGYGFAVVDVEDGKYLVHVLEEDGPAAQAGMEWGAELIAWNGVPVAEALDAVSVLWADQPSPTTEAKHLEQIRFLTRAPAGTEAEVTFKNPDRATPWVAKLEAVDDRFRTLDASVRFNEEAGEFSIPVKEEMLPENVGYIRLSFLGMSMATPFPARSFQNALTKFEKAECAGLIIDLRGNPGGAEELAPQFAGHFTQEERFYRHASVFNQKENEHQIDPARDLSITPREPYWGKPVIVIVENLTMKAAEGLAAALQRRPNVRLMGHHSTHGSYGIVGGTATMPGNFTLHYPIGKNLGAMGHAVIEGNADGEGGVHPDIHLPLTKEMVEAQFVQGGDPLRQAAVDLLMGETGAEDVVGGE